MNVFLYLYCTIGDRSLITQVYYFYKTVFFTDLESVYHILQILIFFMIITLVTTDLPNISGFVGSSLLHILYQAWGAFVCFALTDPAHKVCFSRSHPQRTDHASEESLDNLGRGPGVRNLHHCTGRMQNQIHCDLNVSFLGLSRLLFEYEKWIAFNVYRINWLPIFF